MVTIEKSGKSGEISKKSMKIDKKSISFVVVDWIGFPSHLIDCQNLDFDGRIFDRLIGLNFLNGLDWIGIPAQDTNV